MSHSSTHKPRKRFGQNFLHDPQVIQRIVSSIRPREGQSMVEIGPGEGALTRELLPILGQLDVVELDRDLIPLLESKFSGLGELRIHQADAPKFDFCQLSPGPENCWKALAFRSISAVLRMDLTPFRNRGLVFRP